MNYINVNIDHLGIISKDLKKVKSIMESLGFFSGDFTQLNSGISGETSPKNIHYMMNNTYLECIESKDGDYLSGYLQGNTGLHTVVLATENIKKSFQDLKDKQYEISEILSAERAADHGKNKGVAKFDWIKVENKFISNTLLGIVEHKTPELIFQSERYKHPNGVFEIEALIVNCDNNIIINDFKILNEIASKGEMRYLKKLLTISVKDSFGSFKPRLLEEKSKYVGLIFTLEDLNILKNILIQNKIDYLENENKIIIDLQKDLNLFFIFKV
ncbi:MAG: VOC family protein [Cetobacterium sp.]|uniref:VOC family protein n=1 Tax=Cetobacterium sp. TaxID=2071632 RepID=UPI003EE5939E